MYIGSTFVIIDASLVLRTRYGHGIFSRTSVCGMGMRTPDHNIDFNEAAVKVLGLNEKTVKALPTPERGTGITYFTGATLQGVAAPPGLGVRVTAAGIRSFVLSYRHKGKEHRITIGRYPTWSALTAVKEARLLRQRI